LVGPRLGLDLEVGDADTFGCGARGHDAAQEPEIFLERRVLLLELRDVARELALRRAVDLQLAVAFDERVLRRLVVALEDAILLDRALPCAAVPRRG
jgi:hypothetical protein